MDLMKYLRLVGISGSLENTQRNIIEWYNKLKPLRKKVFGKNKN